MTKWNYCVPGPRKKIQINHIHAHTGKQVDKIKKESTNDRDLPWLRNNFLRNVE
jgi:hypothetical protein